MINITTKLMGGLGNYLFQIAAAYSYSVKTNNNFILDVSDSHIVHINPNEYKNTIFSKLVFNNESLQYDVYNEPNFNFTELPLFNNNTKIVGYFQSEKYFSDIKNEIYNLFINKEIINELKIKYKEIISDDICSIHVRRGDYLKLSDYHSMIPISYYKTATDFIGIEKKYIIFSDDIDWCKTAFSFLPNKTFISGNHDYEDLYLMSLCPKNIIANSSFSWWGAWLNQASDKIVISPKNWFGKLNLHHNTNDLYCDSWIKL
jgi:hypothetical protein